ncbi:MAG: carbamoyl-phosphate synthase large subunit [Phycisphaerales bacterium]|nr:carbamoyl-phosphate synthase large subunit [Phycisphaerales bacterium]
MPKRTDIQRILIIGSGPIVIGQGCEFDYSGTQACKALREEGYSVVLLNSNPATIMTDPEMADRTYIEPITPEFLEKVLECERRAGRPVDAVLPTLGGQTGLNCAVEAADRGIFEAFGVELIGASREVIHRAEDRTEFKETVQRIGLDVARSVVAHTWEQAREAVAEIGLPCVIRPAYTLGGEGGGLATTAADFERIARGGLAASRVSEILIEESLVGWKEFELELMRDRADNVVIICSIENVDPMGVHTGDSITVAPAQTLTDREYQQMRDAAIAIIRAVGVETGGSNIQFAVCPRTGRQVVIEMNPRVSRSSALASKATGYPIAKIAAKLAVGYTLDEIPNDITQQTPASFEPTIDYVVVKIPRWTFEKFPEADETLTTHMKSVGEGMAIGRTFKEAFQKAIRSMEIKRFGYGLDANDKWLAAQSQSANASATVGADDVPRFASTVTEAPPDTREEHATDWPIPDDLLRDKLINPCQGRPYYIRYAFKMGWTVEQVNELTRIDPWFLENMRELVASEEVLMSGDESTIPKLKRQGFSDVQLTAARKLNGRAGTAVGVEPVYKLVDTCAAEFEARTPYYYSSHETPALFVDGRGSARVLDDEIRVSDRRKVVVLGGGPNRIGQGIEFDYCCCHASYAARAAGFESVMINSNPETVSTDYDTSDMLFFEPLTHEDVLAVCRRLNGGPFPNGKGSGESGGRDHSRNRLYGAIVQFGGQTPLNLAQGLKEAGVPILGTSPESIHLAEDREQFQRILRELSLLQPAAGIAYSLNEALAVAGTIGYPVLVRPSYVLGGRAMRKCNNDVDLTAYMKQAVLATDRVGSARDNPVLIDKFLLDAIEFDVDAVADFGGGGPRDHGMCAICGVMEHIEEAGVHSGDSTCVLPPFSVGNLVIEELKRSTRRLAERLGVCGLMNVQFAVLNRTVYVLEVNPRASRTVPFVAKATGIPWARIATRVMLNERLADILAEYNIRDGDRPNHVAVKMPVFPFAKLGGVDVILGPEMRSTGEVMGIDASFGLAFAKAAVATGLTLPVCGNALVSVNDPDKPRMVPVARDLHEMGFRLYSTIGTRDALAEAGIPATLVSKSSGCDAPYLADLIHDGTLQLLINTPIHTGRASDEGRWRAAATVKRIPLITTLAGARAAIDAIREMRATSVSDPLAALHVRALQEYHGATPHR